MSRAPGHGDDVAIRTSGLGKRYGATVALAELELAVSAGEVYGYLGPNGAGKTTTIWLVLGLQRPSEGSAAVEDFGVLGHGVGQVAARAHDKPSLHDRLPEQGKLVAQIVGPVKQSPTEEPSWSPACAEESTRPTAGR